MSASSDGSSRGAAALGAARALLLTLWAGATWTIGFVVAPLLFRWLEPTRAGDAAGALFSLQAAGSIVFAAAYGLLTRAQRGRDWPRVDRALVGATVLCVVIGYYALQPSMSAARVAMAAGEEGARAHFGLLHAVSGTLYLVQGVLLCVLVVRHALGPRPGPQS